MSAITHTRRRVLQASVCTVFGLSGCFSSEPVRLAVLNDHDESHEVTVSIENGTIFDETFGLDPDSRAEDEFQDEDRGEINVSSTIDGDSIENDITTSGLVNISVRVRESGELNISEAHR